MCCIVGVTKYEEEEEELEFKEVFDVEGEYEEEDDDDENDEEKKSDTIFAVCG